METKQRNFENQLKYGKEFEDTFSRFLMKHGWFVTPKYLFAGEGAPILIGLNSKYAIPDIDAAKDGQRIWVECKRKNKMKFHPATGYPKSNHICYQMVQKITGDKVYVVFEDESVGKVYGNWLDELEKHKYKEMFFEGKMHVLFRYPEAFKTISLVPNGEGATYKSAPSTSGERSRGADIKKTAWQGDGMAVRPDRTPERTNAFSAMSA